jgi:rare lipoprotein A (peptidoglycan hydrolase)
MWDTDHIGQFAIRAVVAPSAASPALAQPASATSALTVTVYRPSLATQYGTGFYGQRTACGEKLTKTMIGLANRTLRCGESVALYFRGRTLVVPVIDRGPYANGADWDLTEATGRALGISGTAEIGAVSLPRR